MSCIFVKCEFNIKSSSIKQKTAGVIDGTTINFGYIDIELDDDLYRYDPLGCPNYNCTALVENGDCTCDYTDMNECPKPFKNANCVNQCAEFAPNSSVPMCGTDPWTTLTVGQEQHIFTSNKEILFRYKANPKICEGIVIIAYPIDGYFRGTFGSHPINQREMPSAYYQTYNVFNLCPSDNLPFSNYLSWTADTIYITITPMSEGNITFSLRIHSGQVPPLPSTPITPCTPTLSTHICLDDGVPYVSAIEGPAYQYFTFQTTKPAYYILRAPRLAQDLNLVISDDSDNKKPTFYTHKPKYELGEESDDSLLVYIDQPTLLYIGLYCNYKTNYSFSITSQGQYYSTKISTLPVNAGSYALTKSARLKLPDGSILTCPSWYLCISLTSQYPLEDGNPLWPVPPYFQHSANYESITYEDVFLPNPMKPKSYQMAVILSSKVSTSPTTSIFYSIDVISKSTVEFISTLFNSKGEPLRGSITLNNNVDLTTCNYTDFQLILKAMEKTQAILFNVTDLNSLNNWRYRLEALTIRDNWIGCSNQASSLLNTVNVLKNVSTTYCPYGIDDKAKGIDPCCNSSLSFFQCCVPKVSLVSTVEFVSTQDDKIENQCSSFECTQSVLSEYYKSLSTTDECTVPDYITRNLKLSAVETVRACKVPTRIPCDRDDDCKNTTGTKCDLYSRFCIPNFENTDKIYIECVLKNLSPSVLYAFAQISSSSVNDSLVQWFYNQNIQDDCVSETFIDTDILRNAMFYTSPSIKFDRCYPPRVCLDSSCVLEHDICYDQYYTVFQEYDFPQDFVCSAYGFCQIETSNCYGAILINDPCSQLCNDTISYCGHCSSENQTYCHQVSTITDETNCKSTSACLLPNGEYQLGIEKEECEALGQCSDGCGYECVGYEGCVIENSPNPTDCLTHTGAIWNSQYDVCTLISATSPSTCAFTWINCSNHSPDECYSTTCSVSTIPCANKDSCVNSGGTCSDQFFFSRENTLYPDGVGKCVRGHLAYRVGSIPSCIYSSENDSPMGCFSSYPVYTNKSSCESIGGGKWWAPAINKTQCLSKMGCKTLETNSDNLPFNFRFNEMDEQHCMGCYQSNNEWTQMFSWSTARWIPGIFIENLDWIENNSFKAYSHPKKTFNYRSFYNNLMNSLDTLAADYLRSETFCRMERIQSNLNSISCSCSGGSECFTESIPLVGQTKPCFGESSTFNFDYGEIMFQSESIKQGCPILLISQYSKEIFTSAAPESLPSNFVSYQVPEKYGVLNDKDAIVGVLIGDGIYIKAQFSIISKFTVCSIIPESQRATSKFPVYDFATLINTDKDDKDNDLSDDDDYNIFDGELVILDAVVFNKTNSDGNLMICSNFSNFNPKSSVQAFFPIIRVDGNWNDVSKQVFDKSTRGLLFTLATIYLLVGLWAIFQLGVIVVKQFNLPKVNFQLVNGLTLIVTIFILMRSLYFFILPNGHLAGNPTSDYVLVILPTFIYFTAFTVIIVLWYVIVFLVLKKNRSAESLSRRVSKLVLYVNIVIYLLFIACCLVFTKTQSNPTNDCGSRIIIPAKSSIPQKAISITYAVIQAIISVLLGAAFVYLGSSLFFVMHKTRKALGGSSINSSHYNRIFLLTLICSIGFILHCVFILVLVSGHSSIAFSFVGLIITEIVPTLTILYCYDPFKKIETKSKSSEISM
ncbi:hypothetical protein ACTFIU_004377 [Dictyostelium citrinum]